MSSRILLAVLVPIAVISTKHAADPVAGREKVQQCQTCEQMSIIAEGLSDEDIADIAAWYSHLVELLPATEYDAGAARGPGA